MMPKMNIVIPKLSMLSLTTKFIAVTIVPGPAKIGMAKGEIANPSSNEVSVSILAPGFFDCNISNPIKKMSIPPKTLNAGIVNPKIWKMYWPINMNEKTIRNATIHAVLAISLFFFSDSPSVSFTKMGILAMGFMMAKNAINTVNEYAQIFSIDQFD